MSMASSLRPSSTHPSSSSPPHPSFPRAHLAVPHRRIAALRLRNPSLIGQGTKLSGVGGGGGGSSIEVPKKVRRSNYGGPRMAIPNIPTWAMWVGSVVCLAIPFYKKVLRIEGGVMKAAETLAEGVEKVAEVVEKVATDVASVLPDNSNLKQEILEVEKIAKNIDNDAEKVEDFVKKVDQIKDELDALVEPIIEKAEIFEKETQEKDNKESSDPSSS